MDEPALSTQMVDVSDVDRRLSRLVDAVSRHETRVLAARAGVPIAAVISIEDLKRLERLDRQRASRLQAIAAISATLADVPLTELEAQLSRIATEGPTLDGAETEHKLA
jgi:prevent-host-death family protein